MPMKTIKENIKNEIIIKNSKFITLLIKITKEKEVKSVVVKIDGELSLEDQVKEALKLLLK